MAENKKSFLIYCDTIYSIDHLTNEEKGILFQHILEYVNDMNPTLTDRVLISAWKPIKQHLKRDLEKWRKKAETNRINGKKGGRPPKPTKTQKTQSVISKPKKAVIDIVSVIDNDNVIDNDILNTYNETLKYFDKHLHPKNDKIEKSWIDTIDKLNRIDKIPYEKIIKIVQWARNDDFWNTNFLSLTKLRKKNNEGIPYVVVFYEKMNGSNKKQNNQQDILQKNFQGWGD